MKLFHSTIVVLICFLSAAIATAQDRAAPAPSAANASQAQAAIDRAAAANKYVFLFFWKEKGPQTDKALGIFQPAAAKMADKADVVSIQITDPAEKKVVADYDVSRAPMPMVLAIAPSGAITKALTKTFDEKELRTAFVSTATQRCLKALQARKMVFVCIANQANPQDQMTTPKGVEDFKADKEYGALTEVVLVNVRDPNEATFLKEVNVSAKSAPVILFMAPPRVLVGTFPTETTKDTFVTKLAEAKEACGPGCSCHH